VCCHIFYKLMELCACAHGWQLNVLFPPSFQIQQTNLNYEESQRQQVIEIDFDRMADLINEEIMSDLPEEETDGQQPLVIDYQNLSDLFNEMFWRGVANPQSGDLEDSNNQIYDL